MRLLLCCLALLSCTTSPQPTLPPSPPTIEDPSALLFDDRVVHEVKIEVAPESLGMLAPLEETRVPAAVVFDGERIENVGLRLKGSFGSLQTLEGKPGFSLKFDSFAKQDFHGLTRLILNSEFQDESFVSRRVGNLLWKQLGLPTTRTSYAVVFLNDEHYGVYTVEEAKDKNFLKRHFADTSGNLYEGNGYDLTNTTRIEKKTNETEPDRSDIETLRDVIEQTPDAFLLDELAKHMDVPLFLKYWAVELLLYHWDGYGVVQPNDGCCSPNNYYLYKDPARGFVFIPHGADQLLKDNFYDVRNGPPVESRLASRLFGLPEGKALLRETIEQILDEVWDTDLLVAYLDKSSLQVQTVFLEGGHEPRAADELEPYRLRYRKFLQDRPEIVRQQLQNGW